jgi:hypothetical protein
MLISTGIALLLLLTRLSGLRKHNPKDSESLCHLNRDWTETQIENSNKTLLEEKERNNKEKENHYQKNSGLLPDGKEALISKTLLKEKKRKKHHREGLCQVA